MRIDESQRPWIIASAVILLGSIASFVPYYLLSRNGTSGGSFMGLVYGILGYGFMLFAGLLSVRKKFRVARIGRAQTWMRGHIWLGFIAFPLIFLHAGNTGFRGGVLTTTMMAMFCFVWVSGIAGVLLQHYLPTMMTRQVPLESIYDDIDTVMIQLRQEAEGAMSQLAPVLEEELVAVVGDRTIPMTQTAREIEAKDLRPLKSLYAEKVVPYLNVRGGGNAELASTETARLIFEQVKKMSPPVLTDIINSLADICEEKRQLDMQSRLHKVLHGWLMVHIPLSWALLVMGGIHAIMALRY